MAATAPNEAMDSEPNYQQTTMAMGMAMIYCFQDPLCGSLPKACAGHILLRRNLPPAKDDGR